MALSTDEDKEYTASMTAFVKHLTTRHTYRQTILYSGRVSKCRVCSAFLGKIK